MKLPHHKLAHSTYFGLGLPSPQSDIIIFGAPYDGTTSFKPGTRFASQAMRQDSFGLESYSPYLDDDLFNYAISDAGDLEMPLGEVSQVLKTIDEATTAILANNSIPCMIGGEHLLSYGSIEATFRQYPDLHIIHFDAHTDLRQEMFDCPFSHATVMRRVVELVGNDRLHQFGIRSGLKEEFDFAKDELDFHPFSYAPDALWQTLAKLKREGKPLYISLDLDVLDPSVLPGTGTPEAGGWSFEELRQALAMFVGHNVVAMDMMELAPFEDASRVSTAVSCKLLRELLLAVMAKQ